MSAAAREVTWLTRCSVWFFLACLSIGAGVLLYPALTLPVARWPLNSDDMYYYLLLARQTVDSGVVSADGVRPTNGFHPLYFLMLTSLYSFVPERMLPNAALAILTCFHAATSVLLWITTSRLAGRGVAGLVAGLYAANPFVLAIIFNGVETSLASFFVALALWAHLRYLESGGRVRRVITLASLPLAVAARTDTIFLAVALALTPAVLADRRRRWAPRQADVTLLLLCVTPILVFSAWSAAATGELLQTSGRSLSYWQSVGFWLRLNERLPALGLARVPAAVLLYALAIIVQYIVWLLKGACSLLGLYPVAWALLGAGAAVRLANTETTSASRARLGASLVIFLMLIWAFYGVFFRHSHNWYWHTSVYAWALLLAIFLGPLRSTAAGRLGALVRRAGVRAIAALLLVAAIGLVALQLEALQPRPAVTGASPDPLLSAVPSGSVLGSFDSGALGWHYTQLEVVNLDGLVNNGAYRALRRREIGQYMLDENIEWFLANPKVIERFSRFGLRRYLQQATIVRRADNGVVLYRLRRAAATGAAALPTEKSAGWLIGPRGVTDTLAGAGGREL